MQSPDESNSANLRPAMFRGALWMVGVNVVRRGLGIISTIILARLLPPEAFGLVAMAHVLITMLQVLTEFGFDVALIQKRDASDTHYNTAWTFNVILSLAGAALLIALAVPAAAFYREPDITPIVAALALGTALRGFQNIGIVNFRKDLEFHKEFKFFAIGKVSAFVVTIGFALLTGSYWALVVGTLTNRVVTLIASYALHPYRPRFSIAARRELFSFSIWMFLNNTLRFFRLRGADFVVGRILGPFSLGLFTISQEISSLPANQIVAPINRAIFSGYAKLSHDKGRLSAAFLNVIGVIALVAFPTTIGISVISEYAVPVLLGEKWLGAVPIVELLAIVGLFNALNSNTGSTFIALGRPHIEVILQAAAFAILIPSAILLLDRIGIMGIVYSFLFVNSMLLLVSWIVAMRVLGFHPLKLVALLIRPLAASAIMYVAVTLLQTRVLSDTPIFIALIMSVIVGAMVFIIMLLASWLIAGKPGGAETFALERVTRLPVIGKIAKNLLQDVRRTNP